MTKLADVTDSKSVGEIHKGSSPFTCTTNIIGDGYNLHLTLAIGFVSALHNMFLSPDDKPFADEDMISTL